MNRIWHRRLSLLIFIPFIVIVATGVLLQLKRWVPAFQPKALKSSAGGLNEISSPIGITRLLEGTRSVPEAEVKTWADIKAIDIRPGTGVARVRTKNNHEIQLDLADGKVLHAGTRYAGEIIEIHEGAFFGDAVRYFVFLPASILTLFLILTGVSILVKTYRVRKPKA